MARFAARDRAKAPIGLSQLGQFCPQAGKTRRMGAASSRGVLRATILGRGSRAERHGPERGENTRHAVVNLPLVAALVLYFKSGHFRKIEGQSCYGREPQ